MKKLFNFLSAIGKKVEEKQYTETRKIVKKNSEAKRNKTFTKLVFFSDDFNSYSKGSIFSKDD